MFRPSLPLLPCGQNHGICLDIYLRAHRIQIRNDSLESCGLVQVAAARICGDTRNKNGGTGSSSPSRWKPGGSPTNLVGTFIFFVIGRLGFLRGGNRQNPRCKVFTYIVSLVPSVDSEKLQIAPQGPDIACVNSKPHLRNELQHQVNSTDRSTLYNSSW